MNIEKESKLHKTTRDFIRSLLTYDKMVKLGTPGILLRGYWLDVKKQMHNFKTRIRHTKTERPRGALLYFNFGF